MLGSEGKHGFSVDELLEIQDKIHEKTDKKAHYYDISALLPGEHQQRNRAGVLHMKGVIDVLLEKENGADLLYQ